MSPPAWKSPDVRSLKGEWAAGHEQVVGKAALIASVGGQRGFADWTNPDHRLRRLLSEFIGMAGLTFVLSGGAAILARLRRTRAAAVADGPGALAGLGAVAGGGRLLPRGHLRPLNPATTLAFALRRDTDWLMASVYWIVQFAAAACGSLLGRGFFGQVGKLAATMPQPACPGRRLALRRSLPSAWCS